MWNGFRSIRDGRKFLNMAKNPRKKPKYTPEKKGKGNLVLEEIKGKKRLGPPTAEDVLP